MSEAEQGLPRAEGDLLSAIAETPKATISGAVLMDYYGAVAPTLLDRGLLVPQGYETATTSLADHDDVPVTVTWSPEHQGYGYFSPSAGWVTVPADRLVTYRIAFERLLHQVAAPLFASKRVTPTPLLPDLLWELGDVKLLGRSQPVPLWIGRRIADAGVWSQFVEIVRVRPAPGLRIVLSLTPGDRLPAHILNGHSIIPVRDVAQHYTGLAVDPDLLAARVGAGSAPTNALIVMAADGASLTVRGRSYGFPGSKQRAVIRHLHNAWRTVRPECLTVDVLNSAGYRDTVNTLAKAFSGRTDWRDFIHEQQGRCWMFH